MSKKKVYNQTEVEYKISMYPSRFHGRQYKLRNKGCVTIFVLSLWDHTYEKKLDMDTNFSDFVSDLISIIIMERICLETGFQKIRIKGGSCNPKKDKEGHEYYCIGEYVLDKMGFKWEPKLIVPYWLTKKESCV